MEYYALTGDAVLCGHKDVIELYVLRLKVVVLEGLLRRAEPAAFTNYIVLCCLVVFTFFDNFIFSYNI